MIWCKVMSLRMLTFIPAVGVYKEEIPFESPGTVKFQKAVNEIGKKLSLALENIAVCPPGGAALIDSDYTKTVDEIIDRYGDRFRIINRGDVGF